MRSFAALREVHFGLQADDVLQTLLLLPEDRYKTATQVRGFFQPLLARVKTLPGVVDAAASSTLPPSGGEDSTIEISGKSHEHEWHALVQQVSVGYFRVLRIPFKVGRSFAEEEINDARKVAVVNETFVSGFLRGGAIESASQFCATEAVRWLNGGSFSDSPRGFRLDKSFRIV